MACYVDSLTLLCVYDVRTSQETHLHVYTACYGDSLTSLCVYDVLTLQ
jgi:hypothetical protein